ncbi:MAG: hypothetical protein AAF547_06270, partial [Actinomycetota bacterium]
MSNSSVFGLSRRWDWLSVFRLVFFTTAVLLISGAAAGARPSVRSDESGSPERVDPPSSLPDDSYRPPSPTGTALSPPELSEEVWVPSYEAFEAVRSRYGFETSKSSFDQLVKSDPENWIAGVPASKAEALQVEEWR